MRDGAVHNAEAAGRLRPTASGPVCATGYFTVLIGKITTAPMRQAAPQIENHNP